MTTQPDRGPAKPLPVTIVSGYLGAGKTTLVNSILSGGHGLRIAVLVNDFGKVAVDETLISGKGADVIALANGCMCCQVGGDLYDTIDRILRMRERFDHLLIETSGVADPAKVAQIAVAEPDLDLSRMIVLVDAVNFTTVLADARVADTLLRQVRAADLILFTKTEFAGAATPAELDRTRYEAGAAAPTSLLRKEGPEAWPLLGDETTGQHDRDLGPAKARPLKPHSLPFESWSWQGECTLPRAEILAFAADPSLHIYRLKGRLRLAGGAAMLIHKVGSETTAEEIVDDFVECDLVAIGARPDFNPSLVEAAWRRLIR
jgi:G3E family GTPase